MSNQLLVQKWGATPDFSCVMTSSDVLSTLPEMRTFFGGYNNPIGIEVECEGIDKAVGTLKFWTYTEDGSLRNHGKEFISQPLSGRQIDYAIHELGETLAQFPRLSWSHRTSIHVHVNVSTLREEHLKALTMAYVLFEELFYSMVLPERAGNAFCYKASSLDPADYMRIQDTNKYCGLNLAPIKRQCTVEFRQLHGSSDMKLLRRWIQLIVKLHAWVEKQSSGAVVDGLVQAIENMKFVELATEIWGANKSLFADAFIEDSAMKNALWSLTIANQEYV
jgi:hypothetical protein